MATNGLVLIKPTSTAVTGGSASAAINAGGSVTFTTCETLSLNGVFSSTYDNYMVTCRLTTTAAGFEWVYVRWRDNGSDDSTASSYVCQQIASNSTSVTAQRLTANIGYLSTVHATERCGFESFVYGPNLAQATAFRTVNVTGSSSARLDDFAGTHNQAASYDGFTLSTSAGAISGMITVHGLVK